MASCVFLPSLALSATSGTSCRTEVRAEIPPRRQDEEDFALNDCVPRSRGRFVEDVADEVTDWNEMMFRVGLVAGTNATNMGRVAAIVQASVFDAVNGIDHRYTPIHVTSSAPGGASRRAAAIQAAYAALIKFYGTGGVFVPPAANQQAVLDARRRVALTEVATDESAASINAGIAWAKTVADAIYLSRSTDGWNTAAPTFTGGLGLGQWRPTLNLPAAGTSTPGSAFRGFPTRRRGRWFLPHSFGRPLPMRPRSGLHWLAPVTPPTSTKPRAWKLRQRQPDRRLNGLLARVGGRDGELSVEQRRPFID